jgi:hypothetical protein
VRLEKRRKNKGRKRRGPAFWHRVFFDHHGER